MYKLKDEMPLLYKMFYSQDGNDSLKRAERRAQSEDLNDLSVIERPSSRKVESDRYLLRDYVDQWASATAKELLDNPTDIVSCIGLSTEARADFLSRMIPVTMHAWRGGQI